FPLAGTAAFLAISLPRTFHHIQHAEHFQGQTASRAFSPLAGLELTGRTLVDNLVLGVNAFGSACPREVVPFALLPLFLAGGWWGRQAVRAGARPELLPLAAGFVFISYWLI